MTSNETLFETCLSDVRGDEGALIIAGWPLAELVAKHDYAAAAALLWRPFYPWSAPEISAALGQARARLWPLLQSRRALFADLSPLAAQRLALELCPDRAEAPVLTQLTEQVAALGLGLVLQQGAQALQPDATAEHVSDLLRLWRGQAPSTAEIQALSRYLVCVSEHGLNASTFTARVIAATASDLASALIGALGALKGPLHGGAPGPVLDMLDAIAAPENARAWAEAELAAGRRLMGFGHRIYRQRDPRADVLKQALQDLQQQHASEDLRRAEAIERILLQVLAAHKPTRALQTNVEYYTALLLHALGIEREAFTAVFALGRALGWSAHVFEQQATGRLIRPAAVYTGPLPR